MRERFMLACLVLTLIELAKCPVQKIAGLTGADREIPRAHVKKIERMMAAIGKPATK
jgi:hypothetical protein